jgi:hypothetical protein
MRARIYQQPKTAMQSGTAGTKDWVLEWEPTDRRRPDPLTGWWGSGDTQTQVKLRFDTKDEAVAFAERSGVPYDVELPPVRIHKPKVYADNFKYGRLENWTH